MKWVVQRVKWAKVSVDGRLVSEIGPGFLTLLGFERGDEESQLERTLNKISEMRVFSDQNGKMNLSLKDVGGAHLVVSQFTLAASWESGRRPGFDKAETPARARELYARAIEISKSLGVPTFAGIFGADMKVELLNDGPVTFLF